MLMGAPAGSTPDITLEASPATRQRVDRAKAAARESKVAICALNPCAIDD